MKLARLALLPASLLAGAAAAQTPVVLVDSSTTVAGIGRPEAFGAMAISDSEEWLLIVDTDFNPTPEDDDDVVVLRNGFLTLREGTPLAKPSGATIDEFDSVTIDAAGNAVWKLMLDDPGGEGGKNEGVYHNTRLLVLNGDLLNTPGYARTATWFRFNGFVKFGRDHVLVASEVNDPDIAGFSDQSLILVELDASRGVLTTTDIAHELGNVPGTSFTIPSNGLSFENRHFFDVNVDGDVLWQTRLAEPPASADRAILFNTELVVQEGDPSPIPGLSWGALGNVRLDLNDRGDIVHEGSTNAAQQNNRLLIAKNGVTVMRERVTLPAISPVLINDFGTDAAILVSNAGDVVYRAGLTGSTTSNAIVLANDEVLLQKGVTRVGGVLITEILDTQDSLAMSPDGRYVMVTVQLENGRSAVLELDLGLVIPLLDCGGNRGLLTRESGFATAGGTVTLGMDRGQAIGVTPVLLLSDGTFPGYPPCGLPAPFGELLIELGGTNPFLGFVGTPWGDEAVEFDLPVANLPQLVDQEFYAQGFFIDVGGLNPGVPRVRATNALKLVVGAP